MMSQRIVIAEDHAILRQGLRALLSETPGFEVVDEVSNGRDALRSVSRLKPSLLLIDLSMPGMNGTEAIREIKLRQPEVRIIVLTVHKAEEYVRTALKSGANGYLLKDDTHTDLLSAIESVCAGRVYLSPGVCTGVVAGYLGDTPPATSSAGWESLTHRERQVMKLIAEGHKNKEIADYLSLSTKTVEKHRSNLMRKLDLHNASAITAYAIEHGLAGKGHGRADWPEHSHPGTESGS